MMDEAERKPDPLSLGLRLQPWFWLAAATASLALRNDALFVGFLIMGRLAVMENTVRRAVIEVALSTRDVIKMKP